MKMLPSNVSVGINYILGRVRKVKVLHRFCTLCRAQVEFADVLSKAFSKIASSLVVICRIADFHSKSFQSRLKIGELWWTEFPQSLEDNGFRVDAEVEQLVRIRSSGLIEFLPLSNVLIDLVLGRNKCGRGNEV